MLRQQVLALMLACFLLGFSPAPGWGSPDELKEAWNLNEQVGQLSRAGQLQTGPAVGSEGPADSL